MIKTLIFDCDGVLVDTERDGHRVAFNRAFSQKNLSTEWSVEEYGALLKVAGGKERMRHYFDVNGWPKAIGDRDVFIRELHKLKTDHFMEMIDSGQLALRPGVTRIVDEALAAGIDLAVCSTSNERSVTLVVEKLLGTERGECFKGIFAGDIVTRKKPDPEVYELALDRLGRRPDECMVIEDSRNGLLAAKAAGLRCVITTSEYTGNENFAEADAVVADLGDPPKVNVTIEDLQGLMA